MTLTVIENSSCSSFVQFLSDAARQSYHVVEVNIGERIYHVCLRQSANKAAHSSFETQRRRHQKSKTGVSVEP